MQVYTGKGMETTKPEVGLCSRVVLDLMSGLERLGLDLYTDNYYTSPELYLELYKRGVNACGTVRTNRRGYPKELVHRSKTGKEKGFYDYRSKGWFNRRFINFWEPYMWQKLVQDQQLFFGNNQMDLKLPWNVHHFYQTTSSTCVELTVVTNTLVSTMWVDAPRSGGKGCSAM